MSKPHFDPTEAESDDPVPGSIRVPPDQQPDQQAHEGSDKPADAEKHMGAQEDQVVREKPPTGALADTLDDADDPDPADELTPG